MSKRERDEAGDEPAAADASAAKADRAQHDRATTLAECQQRRGGAGEMPVDGAEQNPVMQMLAEMNERMRRLCFNGETDEGRRRFIAEQLRKEREAAEDSRRVLQDVCPQHDTRACRETLFFALPHNAFESVFRGCAKPLDGVWPLPMGVMQSNGVDASTAVSDSLMHGLYPMLVACDPLPGVVLMCKWPRVTTSLQLAARYEQLLYALASHSAVFSLKRVCVRWLRHLEDTAALRRCDLAVAVAMMFAPVDQVLAQVLGDEDGGGGGGAVDRHGTARVQLTHTQWGTLQAAMHQRHEACDAQRLSKYVLSLFEWEELPGWATAYLRGDVACASGVVMHTLQSLADERVRKLYPLMRAALHNGDTSRLEHEARAYTVHFLRQMHVALVTVLAECTVVDADAAIIWRPLPWGAKKLLPLREAGIDVLQYCERAPGIHALDDDASQVPKNYAPCGVLVAEYELSRIWAALRACYDDLQPRVHEVAEDNQPDMESGAVGQETRLSVWTRAIMRIADLRMLQMQSAAPSDGERAQIDTAQKQLFSLEWTFRKAYETLRKNRKQFEIDLA